MLIILHVFILIKCRITAEINECESDPWVAGGNCTDEVDMFVCECPDGLAGVYCESKIENVTFNIFCCVSSNSFHETDP